MARQYINPFIEDEKFRSANQTSYDLTNKQPAGGPINSTQYNHTHTYTPDNTYLDNFDAIAINNSNFWVIGTTNRYADVLDDSIFSKTNLDIEDDRPLGGPNTTNIPNIPLGSYIPIKPSNKFGESGFPGGPLKTKENKDYKITLQQWNSNNTYLDSIDLNNS